MSLIGITGCSSPEPPKPIVSYEPGESLSSASNYVYKCITDKGWSVTQSWDGGIEVSSEDIPAAQVDLYRADSDACWAQIDNRIASMSTTEISDVYELELATKDCLEAHGYEVGSPPSEQSFVDTFFGDRWSAYADSDVLSAMNDDAAWRKVNEECPQPAWSLGVSK